MTQHILIAVLTYTKPLEEVDALLSKHREYLEKLFNQKSCLYVDDFIQGRVV